MQSELKFSAIVLAAGQGKRMNSALSKVLHQISGKSILERTLSILEKVNPQEIIVVASPKNVNELQKIKRGRVVVQKEPKGTADAVMVGASKVSLVKNIAVLYGDDSAFYEPETIIKVYNHHLASKAKITFVTVKKENPAGLGRIIRKNGKIVAIVEEKDASRDQKKIKEINDGLYFFDREFLKSSLNKLVPSPVTGELYLTDLIALALKDNQRVETYLVGESEWHGINTPEELEEANVKFQKRIHFMGVGGAGASAVAQIAKGNEYFVTGCDLDLKSPYLKKGEFGVKEGHNASHLHGISSLIVSPAILKFDSKNKEVQEAKKQNIPVLTWQEFQGQSLQKGKFVIAVAGSYGKSTTTAMISQILIDQNLDPTCEIGAKVLGWGTNFRVGNSKYLGPQPEGRGPHGPVYVCEADEYNDNFLNYEPDIAVILNIGWDHPDFFKNQNQVTDSFKKFASKIKKNGVLITGTVPAKFITDIRSDINIAKIQDFRNLKLKLIGDFRKENADAALTVAKSLGLDLNKALKSVEIFKGLARRLEYKGQIKNVKFYDDYAVQPYTVLKTADALSEKLINQKISLVFEPHTFSRVNTFFKDFVKSLKSVKVDQILITEVYPAREKGDIEKVSRDLTQAIGEKAKFTGSIDNTADFIKKNLADFDVVLTMGAGRSYELWEQVK